MRMISVGCLLLLVAASVLAQTPVVSSLYPASGRPGGGDFVHIIGANLLSGTGGIAPLPQVRFGDTSANLVSVSNSELIVIAPQHAPGGVEVSVVTAAISHSAGTYTYEKVGSEDFERVLIPIVVGGPGAFGSVWVTNVTAFAANDAGALLRFRDCSIPTACRDSVGLLPNTITSLNLTPDPGSTAAFIYVPHEASNKVNFALRVQDVSRQSQTWGTEIPPVFATDFTDTVWLHDVPMGDAFRSALRIYGYTGQPQNASVNFYDETGKFLFTHNEFTKLSATGFADQPFSPSWLTFANLADSFPQLRGHDRIQIEVRAQTSSLADPAPPPLPLWAFVSVTNNETQHVTTVTPHHAR